MAWHEVGGALVISVACNLPLSEVMNEKKLVYIEFNSADRSIAHEIAALGWEVQPLIDLRNAEKLLGQLHFQVGVVSLLGCDTQRCAEIEDFLLAQRDAAAWVAMVDNTALELEACRRLIMTFDDYLLLPADPGSMSARLTHAAHRYALRAAFCSRPETSDESLMVGNSPAMNKLNSGIKKIARADAPVLINGESGTGKELAALTVHKRSGRAGGPFVAVNCGALPANLIQSELFGFEKGAFTGAHQAKKGLIETAARGTIFLDEIGDLPLEMQTNLLRFLQEKTFIRIGSTQALSVDVRVIAATHVDLEKAILDGRFREDLYYRLNVLHVAVPALRDRGDDIVLLARHFFERFSQERRYDRVKGFSHRGLQALVAHNWPGNVRELINRIQRAIVMCDNCLITRSDLGLERRLAPRNALELDQARDNAELSAIKTSLWYTQNNISQAAKALGVSRVTLYRLMGKHRLIGERVAPGRIQ